MNQLLVLEKDNNWRILDLDTDEGKKEFLNLTGQADILENISHLVNKHLARTMPRSFLPSSEKPSIYNNIPLNPNLHIDGKLVGAAIDTLNENKHLGLKWTAQLNLGRWEGIANDKQKNRYEYRSDWELVAIARMYIKGEY